MERNNGYFNAISIELRILCFSYYINVSIVLILMSNIITKIKHKSIKTVIF